MTQDKGHNRTTLTSNVLVCDDDTVNLEVVRELLEADYAIATSDSGETCLHKITEFQPDVVLLDVKMPKLGGEQISRLLQDGLLGETVDIVLHSGTFDAEHLAPLTRTVGALGYIVKTEDDASFQQQLEILMGKRSGRP